MDKIKLNCVLPKTSTKYVRFFDESISAPITTLGQQKLDELIKQLPIDLLHK